MKIKALIHPVVDVSETSIQTSHYEIFIALWRFGSFPSFFTQVKNQQESQALHREFCGWIRKLNQNQKHSRHQPTAVSLHNFMKTEASI